MFKKIHLILLSIFAFLAIPFVSYATCPVCTVAIASGLGLCRYVGIDDVVSGLWVGGLILSLSMSINTALVKRKKNFKYSTLVLLIANYLLIFVPLQLIKVIGHQFNQIAGMDRLIFGSICGTILVVLSSLASDGIKKQNKNKVLFPYQRVVLPVFVLLVFSLIFYFTIC